MNRRNNSACKQELHGKSRFIILYTAAVLLVLGALWGAKQAGTAQDLRMRQELARQAIAVAAAVPFDEAQALSFTTNDLGRPEYQRLCTMLKTFSELTGLESIYTMKLREDGKLVFGPESLEPDSPGDVYQQPSEKDFLPFQTAEPVVMGPVTDEYGTFVSAAAPVLHPRTGEVLFTVGIDVEVPEWQAEIRRAQRLPLLLVLIPLAILLAGCVLLKQRHRLPPETRHRLRHMEAIICAGISLLLTLAVTLLVAQENRNRRVDTFYSGAHLKAKLYASYFRNLAENAGMLANAFESSERVTSGEFQTLCGPVIRNHPVEGCVWIPEVPAAERELFEAKVRADDYPDFRIRPLPGADGHAPPDMLYPVLYVASADGKKEALGCNFASEPVRRAALMEALQTGRITASGSIRLAARPGAPQGVFIFCPVNAAAQNGALALVIRPERLMSALASQTRRDASGMKACLLQLEPGVEPCPLFYSGSNQLTDCVNAVPRDLQMYFPLFVFGRPYALCITPDSQWFAANPLQRARFVLTAGLILSALLTALIGILANRPRLLERQVFERTAELRESEERTEIATEAAGIGIWDRDIVNNRLVWDGRMVELYGVRKEDFGGAYETWQQCIHPDDLERTAAEVAAAERGEKPFDTEFRIVRADNGEIRHIRAFGKVICDETGRPVRMTGTNQDITEHQVAKQKLKESEEKLRNIVENSTNMFYSHTPEHVLTYVSPQVKDILGYEAEETLARWTELTADNPLNERGFKLTEEAIRTGKAQPPYELQLIHKDGHPVWVEVREAPVVEDGKTVAMVGSLNDITDRKNAEETLKQKMEELERFNKAAVGRELRMIELKKEVNALCRELGRKEPYPLQVEP